MLTEPIPVLKLKSLVVHDNLSSDRCTCVTPRHCTSFAMSEVTKSVLRCLKVLMSPGVYKKFHRIAAMDVTNPILYEIRVKWHILRKTAIFIRLILASILTYLLTPWCRVLLEKLTGLQLVKKFPAFYGTRRFITALTSFRPILG